ncbi:MAG: hypothetical protein AAF846_27050 [Chloroflexota bacterium]
MRSTSCQNPPKLILIVWADSRNPEHMTVHLHNIADSKSGILCKRDINAIYREAQGIWDAGKMTNQKPMETFVSGTITPKSTLLGIHRTVAS